MLKDIVKKNKFLFSLALSYKEQKLNKVEKASLLNDEESAYLDTLKKDGVVAIPNFFSPQECQEMIDSFESLDEKYATYYDNDKRIFGIEHISPIHKKLYHDNEMFKRVGEAYVQDDLILQTTMAAKITPNPEVKYGSGGSWHRDSFSRQFKAVAYLDDVSIDNGPFMYIKGSNTMESIKEVLFKLKREDTYPGDYRYTDKEIEEIQKILGSEITHFVAPKGTLVLADIRGLHTGMPIKEGHRYAVFNYYIAKSFHQPNNEIEQLASANKIK